MASYSPKKAQQKHFLLMALSIVVIDYTDISVTAWHLFLAQVVAYYVSGLRFQLLICSTSAKQLSHTERGSQLSQHIISIVNMASLAKESTHYKWCQNTICNLR